MHIHDSPLEQPRDTIALGDFTADVRGVLRRLRENGQPLVVTENGEAAMVLITPDEFQELRYRQKFVSAVLEGLDDVRSGRVVDDDGLGPELDAEFGALAP
ncbi:MAG TPA: type II toxin-antitoxin system Phd/YefM family antitoxin [Polyangium sp.]|nr:type II toxin-antitoxin system Phd/YefM family antitoxin [Polyangium sp.]